MPRLVKVPQARPSLILGDCEGPRRPKAVGQPFPRGPRRGFLSQSLGERHSRPCDLGAAE